METMVTDNRQPALRILQIAQKPQRRGAEVFAYQLTQALRSKGHTVRIAYLYDHDEAGRLPLAQDDRQLGDGRAYPLERWLTIHPPLLKRLLGQIHEFRPDIVQINGGSTVKYGAFARWLQPHAPWALIYRNIGNPADWLRNHGQRFYYRHIVASRLDGVVGVSQTTLHAVERFYALSIPTVHIPRAVQPFALQPTLSRAAVRQQYQIPVEAPLLIYVGSLTPEKRLDRLLRIMQQVCQCVPATQLWIIGGGPLRAQLEEQVISAGLSGCVQFLGVQEQVANYLQAADLFVLTSDTEGIPGVVLEAGWVGLAAVATNVGGVAECLVDGQTGVLVEPQAEAQFAVAVCTLLQEPERRRQLGRHAHTWIQEHFVMDQIVQNYLDFYHSVIHIRRHSCQT